MARESSRARHTRPQEHRRSEVKASQDHGVQTDSVPVGPAQGPPTQDHGVQTESSPVEHAHGTPMPTDSCDDNSPKPVPSLSELTHLLRLEKYQTGRCRQVQNQVHAMGVAAARTARLTITARSVHRTLAECIKSEDKQSFANLFNLFQDTVATCSDPSDVPTGDASADVDQLDRPSTCFLDVLPDGACATLVEFLLQLRHDGGFIADRIAALSQKELTALLPDRGLSRSSDSVIASSTRASFRTSRNMSYVVDSQTDLLPSFEYASPLETLIHSVRGISNCSLKDDDAATEVWATVCARLISEGRPERAQPIIPIVDTWAFATLWPGKVRLESWIQRTLQKGSFLLKQPPKQTFSGHVQGRQEAPAEDKVKREAFFSEAVPSLLELLADPTGASVIPEGALTLCNAICCKLEGSSGHLFLFLNFILMKWVYSSFIAEAVSLPEGHGTLADYYVSENARLQILREIARGCSTAIFDAVHAWKNGNVTSTENSRLVQRIRDRLRGPTGYSGDDSKPSHPTHTNEQSSFGHESFVVLSAADVKTMINALYPTRRTSSFSFDRDPSQSGLQSSASSISGFSLFQNPKTMSTGSLPIPSLQETPPPFVSDLQQVPTPSEDLFSDAKPISKPSLNEDQLREAFVSIDESTTNLQPSWCVFVAQGNGGDLCTLQESLEIISSAAVASTATLTGSSSAEGNRMHFPRASACRSSLEALLLDEEMVCVSDDSAESDGSRDQLASVYETLLQAFAYKVAISEEDLDFVTAHSFHQKMLAFCDVAGNGNDLQKLSGLLVDMEQERTRSLEQSMKTMDACQSWIRDLDPSVTFWKGRLEDRASSSGQLRDKMWYVADVRTSAAYEEVRSVASALEIMGRSKKSGRNRTTPSLRHSSGSRLANTNIHLKTEAQILELLSAALNHGGPNKLGDEQSRVVSNWMDHNAIENLCRGEERLHKLCMEIRRAVDQITAESSPLLSSVLLARDRALEARETQQPTASSLSVLQRSAGRFDSLRLSTNFAPSIDAVSSVSSYALSTQSSREYLESRSPTLTNKSSATFWSPVVSDAQSPSSATSIGSVRTQGLYGSQRRKRAPASVNKSHGLIERLRQHVTSMLLSDVCHTLFQQGSETDVAFWTGLGGSLTTKHMRSLDVPCLYSDSGLPVFDFDAAFSRLFQRFAESTNPFSKLAQLLDIDMLLEPYSAAHLNSDRSSRPELQSRSMSMQHIRQRAASVADVKVQGFRRLFCDFSMRPHAILRDLQFISALVPSSTLENTPQGKAFWNAAVAIVGLKQEARNIMVETADSIIAYHSNNRGHGRSPSTAQQQRDSATWAAPSRTPSAEDIAHYSMADAASLLQIAAKEGDPAAQRELATLYLTHPELMDHIVAPFSRPRDVFKEELESKWRKNQDPARCDPATMCVAHHWMSLSSRGGDALANEFLRQREEMEKLP